MGCLKNFFAMVGFATVIAAMSIGAWRYRAEIEQYYHEWRGEEGAAEFEGQVGRPGPSALASARRRAAAMESATGPATLVINADEMASLIAEGISRDAVGALDSLELRLDTNRVTLDAAVVTEVFARDLLGQFASLLDRREHISVSGPVRVLREGTLAWSPDRLLLRSFPFPRAVVAPMVNSLTGGDDGAFLIPIPTTVGDVRVRPGGVTFYRRTD